MHDAATIAGHRVTGRVRTSDLGTWYEAVSPERTPSGMLRLDPTLVAEPEARARLIDEVSADRRLTRSGVAGLLPVVDLVAARGQVWLITGHRAMPTLADVLAGDMRLDAGAAAAILVDTAGTMLAVHAAGLTHGALHPGTVVIGNDGSAVLAERGLSAALGVRPASADLTAWVALARGLAAHWARDQSAALLDRAAATATTHGLRAARELLLAERDVLGQGDALATGRARLARAAQWWEASARTASPVSAGDPGDAVTLLDLPTPDGIRGASAGARSEPDDAVRMRFGPGVPTDTTAAQIWRSGQLSTIQAAEGVPLGGRGRRRRRVVRWVGSVVFALAIAAVILWFRLQPGAELAVLKVDVTAPKKTVPCDGTADLVGVVTTNGATGIIRYAWLRSDGEKVQQEQAVGSGRTTVDFPLHWTVKGPGRFRGTATLRILSPTSTGTPMQDSASFSYKC